MNDMYLITIVITESFFPPDVRSIEIATFDPETVKSKAAALHKRIAAANLLRKRFIVGQKDLGIINSEDDEFALWQHAPLLDVISSKDFRYSFYDPNGICVKKFDGERFSCACEELGIKYHPLVLQLL